ncbi:tRNA1(Val) (adenine(37)-N6)-methyltransferase [Clostridiales bacterium BAD-6]|uniref:tRNA1(Val) (Adenine(37)-N6)-methyltransferase n=2 Tax=Sinanaerobacter chloroacetimidivorans TaxID=2818044 RepID=A0A8J7W3X3_9FIRM|nr:tRNA1(Val) (adenine(37)-N6)-methyltransferase [Sinanaerobacter chloroacetimidivorans]
MNWCNEGERIDEIGFGSLRLIQKPEDFCYGIDAVLLASFAEVKRGSRVIDLGTGTGIIPLILSHKTEADEILGVELQQDSYERGLRNIELNHLHDRVKLIHSDVKDILGDKNINPQSFDAVLSNPPYMKGNGGLKNQKDAKTIARHETTAGLSDFIGTAASLLKDKGDFYLVHRPSRLVDICILCRQNKLEPKELRLVSPNRNRKPNILLMHCVKHGRPELKFLDPLYVYEENGCYTEEILRIYERK